MGRVSPMMRNVSSTWRSMLRERKRNVLICVVLMLLLFGLYKRDRFCWGTKPAMEGLYHNVISAMHASKAADWWLDYGTLLGAVRENEILEHEYDIDIGLTREACAVVAQKKHLFSEYGLTLYTRSDHISQKVKLTWNDLEHRFKMSSGYLHVPCLRAYDSNGYFVDFYDYTTLSSQTLAAMVHNDTWFRLPKVDPKGNRNWSLNSLKKETDDLPPMLCCTHGLDPAESEQGGCQLYDTVFPLQHTTFLGKEVNLPRDTDRHLIEAYGDDWRIPHRKGIKGPLCYFESL
ncbi:hypothetical protein DIPPA_52434 [Diplonema papillatum]|nr:hypothetical protein DIPPA_52434 [Diplonema papillatum]